MRIGNRYFSYPILNATPINSTYKEGWLFRLNYDGEIVDDTLVLENLYCDVKSKFLNWLLDNHKAQIVLYIECPQALYRNLVKISEKPEKLVISAADLSGPCVFSAFIVATEDITIENSTDWADDFIDDYLGERIEIDNHEILAIDELHQNRVDFDTTDDIKKASIFQIYSSDDIQDGTAMVEFDEQFISIYVNPLAFSSYDSTKAYPELRDTYLSMLAVPALTQCIRKVLGVDVTDMNALIDKLSVELKWFSSFCIAFNKKYGHEFCEDDCDDLDNIIQKLFDAPIGKAIVYLAEFMNPNSGGDGNED